MTPIGKNGSFILWGEVTWDAKVYEARTGNKFTSFRMKYNRGHNVDGVMVNDTIEVTFWDSKYTKLADLVGDPDFGIAKGDIVLVCGQLVEDTYRKEGEDPNTPKWKINADIVIDMTSIFQVAQMVVHGGGTVEEEEPTPSPHNPREKESPISKPAKPKFKGTVEKTPFMEEIEESDGELPF